jgi:hypothetical protein
VSWCKTCDNFMLFPNSHRCPPAFECENDYHGSHVIRAIDSRAAAEKFADECDSNGDYTCVQGSPMLVKVTAADGTVEHFEVEGESVPSYTAYRREQSQ